MRVFTVLAKLKVSQLPIEILFLKKVGKGGG